MLASLSQIVIHLAYLPSNSLPEKGARPLRKADYFPANIDKAKRGWPLLRTSRYPLYQPSLETQLLARRGNPLF